MDGPSALIRTDPAPGFKALVDDPLLKKHRITIELGRAKLGSLRSLRVSLREMWTQWDQFSNQQITLADDHLIALQHEQCLSNHPLSEHSKAPLHNRCPTPFIDVGDLVYLHSDRNKSRACNCYLVVPIDSPFCDIKKFIGSQLQSSS